MGIIKLIVFSVVGLIVLVGAAAGIYYASDGAVEANIEEARCGIAGGGEVDLVTTFPFPGIPYTLEDLNSQVCQLFTQKGNHAVYNLKSERTRLYTDDSKACLKYDSDGGRYSANGCL